MNERKRETLKMQGNVDDIKKALQQKNGEFNEIEQEFKRYRTLYL
jgi:hypothetical protein